MPLIPNFIERLVLLKLNQGPGLMLDILGADDFRAACAGVKLGIFEALSDGPLTADETARQVKASERGTSLLLDALMTLGYVQEKNGRYANTFIKAA
jgi:Dimerisation domain